MEGPLEDVFREAILEEMVNKRLCPKRKWQVGGSLTDSLPRSRTPGHLGYVVTKRARSRLNPGPRHPQASNSTHARAMLGLAVSHAQLALAPKTSTITTQRNRQPYFLHFSATTTATTIFEPIHCPPWGRVHTLSFPRHPYASSVEVHLLLFLLHQHFSSKLALAATFCR